VKAARAAPSALDVSPWTMGRSGACERRGSSAAVTAPTWACGSFLAGAIEPLGRQAVEAEFMAVQGVLAGEDERRFNPARGQ
jgi:hypothetical protein